MCEPTQIEPEVSCPRLKRHTSPFLRSRFDLLDGPDCDLLLLAGLLHALRKVLRLKAGALLWGGNPCSNQSLSCKKPTFDLYLVCMLPQTVFKLRIFLSSSIHRRSASNPLGDTTQPRILSFVCRLLFIMGGRDCPAGGVQSFASPTRINLST